MTHSVSPAHSAPASDAAARPARGDDQADRSRFALMLNVQLAAKIPELVGRERLSDRQLDAQERREERRSDRADAQDPRARAPGLFARTWASPTPSVCQRPTQPPREMPGHPHHT